MNHLFNDIDIGSSFVHPLRPLDLYGYPLVEADKWHKA